MTNLWIPSVSIEHQSNHSIFTKKFLNHIQILFLLSKLNFTFGQIGIYISEGLANTISLITSLADCYLIQYVHLTSYRNIRTIFSLILFLIIIGSTLFIIFIRYLIAKTIKRQRIKEQLISILVSFYFLNQFTIMKILFEEVKIYFLF